MFPQRPGRPAVVQERPVLGLEAWRDDPALSGRTFQIVRLRHDANPPQLGKVVRQERAAETLKASQSQG